MLLSEKCGVVSLLGPTADYNGSTIDSDAVNLKNYSEASFLVQHKGGSTGKSTLTVLAASDGSGTGATAIPFLYRRKTTGASSVWGAISVATAAGIDTVPAEDTVIEIFVKGDECPEGKPFVNIHAVESVNDPVVGAILAILTNPRFAGTTHPDALA